MAQYDPDINYEDMNEDEYIAVSLKAQEDTLAHTYRGIDHRPTSLHMPLYFWLIDGREAIITIPTYGPESTEYGFRTTDDNFLKALSEMLDRY